MTAAPDVADLKVALWPLNHAHRVAGPQAWLDMVAGRIEVARKNSAHLLVLPEYLCVHWLHWSEAPLAGQAFMDWMADQGAALLPALERMVLQTGVGLIAGTMPHRVGSHGTSNRSWILLPDGKGQVTRAYHDKLVPTPSERTHGEWPIIPGKSLTLIEWRGLKLAVLICLDVEVPAVIARLQEEAIDLLIIPSQTELKSGYHRVFDCAKACAIEMFTSVAVMGGIGTFPGGKGGNCSGAAAYVPCEAALGTIGSIASIGPFDHTEGLGPLLFVDIPVATIRELRRNGPEAWPGPFSGKDMTWSRWKVEA